MKPSRWAIGLVVVGVLLLGLSFVGRPGPGVAAIDQTVVAAAPELSPAELGRALFRAKGCAACHENGVAGAPNLATYDPNPEFLRSWLKDPSAIRPQTSMPNLELKQTEIEALIAFLEVQSTEQAGQP